MTQAVPCLDAESLGFFCHIGKLLLGGGYIGVMEPLRRTPVDHRFACAIPDGKPAAAKARSLGSMVVPDGR